MNFIIVPISLTSKIGMWAVDQKLMINLMWSNVSQACTELYPHPPPPPPPPPLAACHTANIQSWTFFTFHLPIFSTRPTRCDADTIRSATERLTKSSREVVRRSRNAAYEAMTKLAPSTDRKLEVPTPTLIPITTPNDCDGLVLFSISGFVLV